MLFSLCNAPVFVKGNAVPAICAVPEGEAGGDREFTPGVVARPVAAGCCMKEILIYSLNT